MAGYSAHLIRDVQSAPQWFLGVRLGRICVERNIPVADVAKFLGATRMTVYFWFRGKFQVSDKYVDKVQKLIEQLG